MNFVSFEFALLFALVAALMLLLRAFSPSRRAPWEKLILLTASCAFYAYWDWRFLGLLALVTLMDYYISVLLCRTSSARRRKTLLLISVVANLGILGYFKYFNFFLDTFNLLLRPAGLALHGLDIILPIGISFYIFETLSYVIDVYRGVAQPAHSLLDYAVFITFFPRLVAGPIMRAAQFLPQLERGVHLSVEDALAGAQLLVRGCSKKWSSPTRWR